MDEIEHPDWYYTMMLRGLADTIRLQTPVGWESLRNGLVEVCKQAAQRIEDQNEMLKHRVRQLEELSIELCKLKYPGDKDE